MQASAVGHDKMRRESAAPRLRARGAARPSRMASSAGFWIVVSLMALAEAAIIAFALRIKAQPGYARGLAGSRPAEVVWTLLPAGLVALLIVVSWGARQ